jgi:hypothetical protein
MAVIECGLCEPNEAGIGNPAIVMITFITEGTTEKLCFEHFLKTCSEVIQMSLPEAQLFDQEAVDDTAKVVDHPAKGKSSKKTVNEVEETSTVEMQPLD